MRNYGSEYEVSVYAYYKVAMAKRIDRDDIEDECFDAVKNLYANESDINVIDIQLMGYKQGKSFTFADVGLELRIKVTEHTYERAYAEAEKMATIKELPVGVTFFAASAYDHETDHKMVVGE